MKKTSELIWQDSQHQELFKLIDALQDPQCSIAIFSRLRNYADYHFSLEETYMHELSYPHTDTHIASHDQFRQELDDMIKDMAQMSPQVRESISIFLREWLTRHVFGIDKDFEAFVLASNVK